MQNLQRLRAAIYQVAHKPETIAGPLETNTAKKFQQVAEATLDITDRIRRHARSLIPMVRGAILGDHFAQALLDLQFVPLWLAKPLFQV